MNFVSEEVRETAVVNLCERMTELPLDLHSPLAFPG